MNESSSGPLSRPPTPEVLAALKELQAEYVSCLPGFVEKLTESVKQVRRNPEDSVALGQVRIQAHKLRGSAGSYGFPEVGNVAAQIEDIAVEVQNGVQNEAASGGSSSPRVLEAWPDVERAMGELAAVAQRIVENFHSEVATE